MTTPLPAERGASDGAARVHEGPASTELKSSPDLPDRLREEGLTAFLKAVSRFIEAEYMHGKAVREHQDRGGIYAQDSGSSRDAVDLAHADLMIFPAITADVIAIRLTEAATALEEARRERDEALKLMSQYAREAGEATGRLEMSEAAGIVDGWRERAQAAEAERDRLREALKPFARYADQIEQFVPDSFVSRDGSPQKITVGHFRRARTAMEKDDVS